MDSPKTHILRSYSTTSGALQGLGGGGGGGGGRIRTKSSAQLAFASRLHPPSPPSACCSAWDLRYINCNVYSAQFPTLSMPLGGKIHSTLNTYYTTFLRFHLTTVSCNKQLLLITALLVWVQARLDSTSGIYTYVSYKRYSYTSTYSWSTEVHVW